MKNKYVLSLFILLVAFGTTLTNLSAQKRYNRLPRVKVNKHYNTEIQKQNLVTEPVTQEVIVNEPVSEIKNESVPEETYVAETSNEVKPVHVKKKSAIEKPVQKTNFVKKTVDRFTEKLKNNSTLLHVKEVKKTNLIGFILWFIIVIILAAILLAVAFILLGAISYSLWYIFLVIGAVALIVAIILLILGVI